MSAEPGGHTSSCFILRNYHNQLVSAGRLRASYTLLCLCLCLCIYKTLTKDTTWSSRQLFDVVFEEVSGRGSRYLWWFTR